jgi:hypothetical protein
MNASSWRGLILTLVIAAAAGFAGAKLGALGPHFGAPAPAAGQGSVRQAVDALLDRDFKLSPAQKQEIAAIDDDFTRTHNQIWSDISGSNARLASAVATDLPSGRMGNGAGGAALSPNARASILGIQDAVGRLHTESILYVLKVREVLTPQQRNDFDEHIIMALMRSPP